MTQIRVGCAVAVIDKDKLLLGQRGKEPHYGKWVIPGGGVDFGEPHREAGKREICEETGLVVVLDDILYVHDIITLPDEHRVITYYEGRVVGGKLRKGSDLLAVDYFTREQIGTMIHQGEVSPAMVTVLERIGWYLP